MVLARALTFGGAVALATASASDWFSYDAEHACGWTCYSPSLDTTRAGLPEGESLHRLVLPDPSTAFDGLGAWVAAAGVVLVLAALVALWSSARGRRVPLAVAAVAGAAAVAVVVRVATQPDVTAHHTSNAFVHVEAAAYAGAAAAIAAAAGVILLARRGRLESRVA